MNITILQFTLKRDKNKLTIFIVWNFGGTTKSHCDSMRLDEKVRRYNNCSRLNLKRDTTLNIYNSLIGQNS